MPLRGGLHDVAVHVLDLEVPDGCRRRVLLALQRVALQDLASVHAARHRREADHEAMAVPEELDRRARVPDGGHARGNEVDAVAGAHLQPHVRVARVRRVSDDDLLHAAGEQQVPHAEVVGLDVEAIVVDDQGAVRTDFGPEAPRPASARGQDREGHLALMNVIERKVHSALGSRHEGLQSSAMVLHGPLPHGLERGKLALRLLRQVGPLALEGLRLRRASEHADVLEEGKLRTGHRRALEPQANVPLELQRVLDVHHHPQALRAELHAADGVIPRQLADAEVARAENHAVQHLRDARPDGLR
mmetsp:Transcript_4322/g.16932  ORF Transcript_4322/g.16932 Transcript_4322/m.16932 type:complete len:303 (+) Transcript_4322:2400-3308(+)